MDEGRYIGTHVEDPSYFSDEGRRLDFSKVKPELSPEAEEAFNNMRDSFIKYKTVQQECKVKTIPFVIPVGLVALLLTRNLFVAIVLGLITYVVVYSKFYADSDGKKYEVSYFSDKYADLCLEPLLAKVEPGVDVSNKLIYYPLFGYIEDKDRSYNTGLIRFGDWLFKIGVLPTFNYRAEVGISINTLNANREGFFLSNIKTFDMWEDSKDHKHVELVFKGPIITVRLKNGINGWFSCHTTKRGNFKSEVNGKYRDVGEVIDVENIQFNERFNVYASSQTDAFYILTPLVVEKLMKLREIYKSFGLYVSGDFCIFAIHTNMSYFDVPDSIKDAEQMNINKYWNDLSWLVNFVYSFKDAVDLNFKQ